MSEVIIPIVGMDVDESFVEFHCTAMGLDVVSVRLAPSDFSLMVGGHRWCNGDRGVEFWLAEIEKVNPTGKEEESE